MKYIDIHSHSALDKDDVLVIHNVFPAQADQMTKGKMFSAGLHPWHVTRDRMETDIMWVQEQAARDEVVAIGETGLDKAVSCPPEDQLVAFIRQVSIAEAVDKPVIIHCVKAYSEMLAHRKNADQRLPWIFHWFNGSRQTAEELVRKNCYLSFGHMLFNERSKAFRAFLSVPGDHIFLETDDAGYSIYQVYDRAALLAGMHVGELKKLISENFLRCFSKLPNGILA